MTVETPGWSTIHRRASCAVVAPDGVSAATSRAAATPTSYGTPENVSPTSNASPLRLNARWSVGANSVCSSYLPDSRPLASGTRAMMPTPASAAAGSTRSRGLRRKALRMIWIVATCGRAIAASASSTVSTDTPYAATRPSSTRVSSAS